MENVKPQPLKALIIDDNEVNTIVLANMLKLHRVEADHAISGMDALEICRKTNYDLIFVDHIMPIMDGVQTTIAIRGLKNYRNSIILALTSSITDEVKCQYQYAGANEVYIKPLDLAELGRIIKLWFPQLSGGDTLISPYQPDNQEEDDLVGSILSVIEEIHYETGLKYALGNPKHYMEILRVSLKDIQTCLNLMNEGNRKRKPEEIRIGVHNIKNVFANIGASALSELSKVLEQIILQQDISTFEEQFAYFVNRVNAFYKKIEEGLTVYRSKAKKLERVDGNTIIPMTKEEYEQRISNTIYYIRRFDYMAILKELEDLIRQEHPNYQYELEQAMTEIRDYQYESILSRMLDLKDKIDKADFAE